MSNSQPNILLMVMDTARAKTVLGSEEVMPNFHRIAEEGTLFTNAFSTAPWTLPSHASMFTGQYTSDHNTHAGNKLFVPDVPTIAELLHEAGYQTVAFSNNVWISPEFGFDRGFDQFTTNLQLLDGGADLPSIAKEKNGILDQSKAIARTLLQRDGHRTLINAIYAKFLRKRYDSGALLTNWRIRRWLSKSRDPNRPFFMFVNYLEPHLEYDPPKKFREKFLPDGINTSKLESVNQDAWAYICGQVEMDERDFEALSALYKAELRYLDYRICRVYEYLKSAELLEETMIIIVGDHGENIGDHGLMDHQYCLYDTLLHVPLLVRYPSEFPGDEQRDKFVELCDMYPTLLEAAEVDQAENSTVSSKPLQQTLTESGHEYMIAEYITPQPSMNALKERTGALPEKVHKYDQGLRSIRKGRWKVIVGSDNSTRLYDLIEDSSEQSDVSEENETIVTELISTLEARLGSFDTGKSVDNHEIESTIQGRLEDLGYLQ